MLAAVDVYLTDEIFLYRIVGAVAGELSDIIELEDCYSLNVARVPLRALRERRLRVVTPGLIGPSRIRRRPAAVGTTLPQEATAHDYDAEAAEPEYRDRPRGAAPRAERDQADHARPRDCAGGIPGGE